MVMEVDRHPAVADLAERARVVGVAAHQGRHVEGDRQAAATLGDQVLVALVGLTGVAEPGELPDRPGPAAVHRRVHAAGERVLAGDADRGGDVAVGVVEGVVEGGDLLAGEGGEVGLALSAGRVPLLPAPAQGAECLGPIGPGHGVVVGHGGLLSAGLISRL
jgi:hypothetical protein